MIFFGPYKGRGTFQGEEPFLFDSPIVTMIALGVIRNTIPSVLGLPTSFASSLLKSLPALPVITGGEPLAHKHLPPLLDILKKEGF